MRRPRVLVAAVAFSALTFACACSLTDLDGLTRGDATAGTGASGTTADGAQTALADASPGSLGSDATALDSSSRQGGTYHEAVLADAPLVFLRLGEPSGASTASDASGHRNDGTLGSGHVFGIKGALANDTNTALHLDGTTSGVSLGPKLEFSGTQAFTLEAWVRPNVSDRTFRHIFKRSGVSAQGKEAYVLYFYDGDLHFERYAQGIESAVNASTATFLGRFAHVAATYDGTRLALYVDGTLVGNAADANAMLPAGATCWVGSDGFNSGVLDADLDEVAIYDAALPPSRISAHVAVAR